MLFGYQLVKSLYLRIIRTDKALCVRQRINPRFQLIYIRSKRYISRRAVSIGYNAVLADL